MQLMLIFGVVDICVAALFFGGGKKTVSACF